MSKLVLFFSFFWIPLIAATSEFFIDNDHGLALEGYDVVTYFEETSPQIGVKLFETEWKGVKWRFINAENLKKFEMEPEKYAPQYGGYCGWALSQGRLRGGLPTIWFIDDGKLYLMCSYQALQEWQEGGKEMKKLADQKWPMILQKNE